jgi:hypothetical protein
MMIGILVGISLGGCLKIDHEVSGEVDINPPSAVIGALLPFAELGYTLDPTVPDSFNLYCTLDACITAGDTRAAATALLGTY